MTKRTHEDPNNKHPRSSAAESSSSADRAELESEQSFPASDAPSWPVVNLGAPVGRGTGAGGERERTIGANHVRLKRVYERAAPEDGVRVLVDRLWPRGLTKEKAAIDHWMKEIAPSPGLRKWFRHDPDRWAEFRHRYVGELRQHADLLDEIRGLAGEGTVTLLFGAQDEEHNDAVVLREVLVKGMSGH